jgi:hypothetical protein
MIDSFPFLKHALRQEVDWPLALALDKAGSSIAARMAIMATTTSSSIKVKPPLPRTFARDEVRSWMEIERLEYRIELLGISSCSISIC